MKKSIFYISIVVVLVFSIYTLSESSWFEESNVPEVSNITSVSNVSEVSNKEPDVKLKTELVCMVNDAFMGIKQFPVPMGDKMYYGCCEQCVDKIKNNRQFRYAKDPLTGEEVDKALAFIVMKSEKDHSVYYFKSENNYSKFQDKLN